MKWHGCYDLSWQGLITPESFAHPAKFSRGLIERIVTHGIERGWLAEGDTVVDPFGGVALGGIICGYHGINWRGVELEQKFVELGNANIALHAAKWKALGYDVSVQLVQGDSRNLREIVGQADGVVCSPPYAESVHDGNGVDRSKLSGNPAGPNSQAGAQGYGSTPGQIGRMKAGDIDAVVCSPPYGEGLGHKRGKAGDQREASGKYKQGYTQGSITKEFYSTDTDGQIGNLKAGQVDAVVTSPPYEGTIVAGGGSNENHTRRPKAERPPDNYGTSDSQIGNTTGPTYWEAVRDIYAACLDILKPGGVLVCVVKAYVKNKQIVPLPDDTLKLLVHLGFEPVERVQAMLVKETKHPDLFGGHIHQRKERKSFFRRLCESKGSPAIDWEDVLIVRKPQSGG